MKQSPVLFFAYYFPPENTSGAARPFRFFKYLPQFGFEPLVVCGSKQSESAPLSGVQQVDSSRNPAVQLAVKVVERVAYRYSDRLAWVPSAVKTAARILKTTPVGFMLSTQPPIATHLAALRIKKRFGLKWIADFRDPIRFDDPQRGRRYVSTVERAIFQQADMIIANTESAASLWRSRYPQWKDKIVTIWNGFDPGEELSAAPIEQRRCRVIVHTGDIYGPRHPGTLLSSLSRLMSRGLLSPDQYRLRLIGPLDSTSPLLTMPAFIELSRNGTLEVTGQLIPRKEALEVIATADYLLLLDITLYQTNVQVPAKLFDYIRVGRPILAFTSKGSPAQEILSRSGIPSVCVYPQDDDVEVDRKLISFLSLPTEPTAYSDWFSRKFDAVYQTEALAHLLERLR